MKGTQTPDCCIIGARAVLNKKYKVPKYSLIGNTQSAQLIEEDYLLVPNNNPQGDPTRKLTQEEIDADPVRWEYYDAGYPTNAFYTKEEAIARAKEIIKARFDVDWVVKVDDMT
jgi:hypothetical protein